MHRLLTGTGMALVLMSIGPAWAQSPTAQSTVGSPSVSSSPAQPNMPTAAPYAQQAPAMPQAQPYAQAPARQPMSSAQQMPMQPPAGAAGATTAGAAMDSDRGMSRHRHSMRSQ